MWTKLHDGHYRNEKGHNIIRVLSGKLSDQQDNGMRYLLLSGWFVVPKGKHVPRRTRYKTLSEAKASCK